MGDFMRRFACGAFGLVLAATTLGGCGGAPVEQRKPETAADVFEFSQANGNVDNVHVDGTFDIAMSMLGMDMPINMVIASDVADGNSHSTISMSAEVLGQKQETTLENYAVKKGDTYQVYASGVDDTGATGWTVTESESNAEFSNKFLNKSFFEKGKFEATDDGYTVTVDGEEFVNMLDELDLNLDEVIESLGSDLKSLLTEDSKTVYTFDKDCLVKSVSMKLAFDTDSVAGQTTTETTEKTTDAETTEKTTDAETTEKTTDAETTEGAEASSDELKIAASLVLDAKLEFSDYGKIDAAKVAVPDDVKNASTPADAAA